MKKITNTFLALVFALTSVFALALYGNADTVVKKGDINNNGTIDSLAYVLLKRAYFGTYVIKE